MDRIRVSAPPSLGLLGDLDDVDLIEDIEEAFGYRLSDDDIERCVTVGDLFALVEKGLPDGDSAANICATSMCFYRLRKALQPRTATALRPKVKIDALGRLSVRHLHRIIHTECSLRPPPPYMSWWGVLALAGVITAPAVLLFLGFPWWLVTLSALPPIALYRATPICLPKEVTTFGDLVRVVASRSIGILARQGARLGPIEAWAAFRDVVAVHTRLPKEQITPDVLLLAPRKSRLAI